MEPRVSTETDGILSYFGYGVNASPEIMDALFDRAVTGMPVVVRNYALYIHPLVDAPRAVYENLQAAWGSGAFKVYFLRRSAGQKVRGILWTVSFREKAVLDRWNFVGPWYKPRDVSVFVEDEALIKAFRLNPLESIGAVTETSRWNAGDLEANGMNYPEFINDREKTLALAKDLRSKIEVSPL